MAVRAHEHEDPSARAPFRPAKATDPTRTATVALVVVLVVMALLVAAPYAGPLVLGIWAAALVEPLTTRLAKTLGSRARAAPIVTLLAFVVICLPIALVATVVYTAVERLLPEVQAAVQRGALARVVGSPDADDSLASLAKGHGDTVLKTAVALTSVTARVAVQWLVLLVALYGAASTGREGRRWLHRYAPFSRDVVDRLANAFHETGRGLIVASGLTALTQGIAATAIYLALGVPQAILFGAVTGLAAFIPVVGTAIVWVPLSIGLFFHHEPGRALLLAVLGGGVIATIDNVIRPMLARHAKLRLDYTVLFIAMIGGATLLGAWGLLLGPLVVRLALEALHCMAERRTRVHASSA